LSPRPSTPGSGCATVPAAFGSPSLAPTEGSTLPSSTSPTPTPTSSPTAGCAATAPEIVWDVAPFACTSVPIQALPSPGTKLAPGVYTNTSLQPGIIFAVGRGWTATQAATGFFDIEDDPGSLDVVAVQFGNVVGVGSASEAVAEISESSDLTSTIAEPVTIDGYGGLRVVVQTTDAVDTDPPVFRPVLNVPAGPLSIASGRRLQATVLDVDDGVLAILVGGSIAEWDHALEIATPVVESIRIGD
jgi:hypothetical protein